MADGYHYGFLAEDLERAIEDYEAVFGVRFREPETRRLQPAPGSEDALGAAEEVRFAFSAGTTLPYVELIEATADGLFGRQQGEGLHHLGLWAEDMDAARSAREGAGLAVEASFRDPDGQERVFYAGAGAVRVETVNARMRDEYMVGLAVAEPARVAPSPSCEPYHLAYMVADLEQAMPRYEAILGVRFRPPMVRTMHEGRGPGRRDPSPASTEVVFTYSLGPEQPYVELIEAGEGPVFGAVREGFHHLGVWVPDLAAAQRDQAAAGAECEGRFFSPDGLERVWFAQTGGVRAEFVNEAIRPQTEAWLRAE